MAPMRLVPPWTVSRDKRSKHNNTETFKYSSDQKLVTPHTPTPPGTGTPTPGANQNLIPSPPGGVLLLRRLLRDREFVQRAYGGNYYTAKRVLFVRRPFVQYGSQVYAFLREMLYKYVCDGEDVVPVYERLKRFLVDPGDYSGDTVTTLYLGGEPFFSFGSYARATPYSDFKVGRGVASAKLGSDYLVKFLSVVGYDPCKPLIVKGELDRDACKYAFAIPNVFLKRDSLSVGTVGRFVYIFVYRDLSFEGVDRLMKFWYLSGRELRAPSEVVGDLADVVFPVRSRRRESVS